MTNEYNSLNFTVVESLLRPINIESLPMKCFTLFSYLDKLSRVFQIQITRIRISIVVTNNMYPKHLFNHYFFAIHSPNNMPDESDFKVLFPASFYKIEYNQLKTILLGNSYDTDCYDYDMDYKFANFNMRSDCITTCIEKFIERKCNLSGLMLYGGILRSETLEMQNLSLLPFNSNERECQFETHQFARRKCDRICKKDCSFIFYPCSYIEYNYKYNYRIDLIIQHNEMPDITIEYLPQNTFLSFVCDFAGVLGLWLGLSFLSGLDIMFLIFRDNIRRILTIRKPRISIKIFRKINREYKHIRFKRIYLTILRKLQSLVKK